MAVRRIVLCLLLLGSVAFAAAAPSEAVSTPVYCAEPLSTPCYAVDTAFYDAQCTPTTCGITVLTHILGIGTLTSIPAGGPPVALTPGYARATMRYQCFGPSCLQTFGELGGAYCTWTGLFDTSCSHTTFWPLRWNPAHNCASFEVRTVAEAFSTTAYGVYAVGTLPEVRLIGVFQEVSEQVFACAGQPVIVTTTEGPVQTEVLQL